MPGPGVNIAGDPAHRIVIVGSDGTTTPYDTNGNLNVNINTAFAGEDTAVGVLKTESRFTPYIIATTSYSAALGNPGANFLHTVVVSQPGTSMTFTLYDDVNAATATNRRVLLGPTPGSLGQTFGPNFIGSYTYDMVILNGVFVTVSCASGPAPFVTVMQRA